MSAITFTSSVASISDTGAEPAPADLDAEKAKCESQLADWVHCVSASTPEGKAKIEQLSARLSAINAKVEKAAEARAEIAKSDDSARTEPAKASLNSVSTLGHVLDAFA